VIGRRLSWALVLAFAAMGATWPGAASAHEIGAGRVEVFLFPDGAFRVDLQVDPDLTLQRLQLAAGETLTPELPDPVLRARLLERRAALLATTRITAAGAPQTVSFDYLPAPPRRNGLREATLRLAGRLPAGAGSLRLAWTLPAGRYALVAHRQGEEGNLETYWVEPGEESPPLGLVPSGPTRTQVARQYLALGYTHILPLGLDHILFVLGIFLFATRLRPVLLQVTAFTVAHSITLGLSIYGVLSLPSSIVEPAIALSIVYVAVENVLRPQLTPWRVAVVFGFGLLHGLGFAGALHELGLPRSEFLTALLTFNVGVEAGQLSVILLAFLLVGSWARREVWYRSRVVVPASLAIAAVGLYWTVQRAGL
jgi:hydrogenase/urease accessory protein HupE